MILHITNTKLYQPGDSKHLSTVSIVMKDGSVFEILEQDKAPSIEVNQTWDAEGSIVTVGFFDLRARSGEPGHEYRESLKSLSIAALKGGITELAHGPDTFPIIDNHTGVQSLKQKSRTLDVKIHPIGAFTEGMKGQVMAELFDMYQNGAIAFYDDTKGLESAGVLMRGLQYLKPYPVKVWVFAEDHSLGKSRYVPESATALAMGLKGVPVISETIAINKYIEIARYTQCPIHICGVSTKEGVDAIAEAKAEGLKITADVAYYQLVFDESILEEFNSIYKVKPIIRSKFNQNALWQGLIDGTIDAIASEHTPIELEGKEVEFENASPGMAGVEILYSALNTYKPSNISSTQLIEWLISGGRNVCDISIPLISKGTKQLVFLKPEEEYTFEANKIASLSKNYPFIGQKLKGKVFATITGDRITQY